MHLTNQTPWTESLGELTQADQDTLKTLSAGFKAEAERIRLGRELQSRITELGLTQKELATLLEIQPAELNRILRGRSNFTANAFLRITLELGLSVQCVRA